MSDLAKADVEALANDEDFNLDDFNDNCYRLFGEFSCLYCMQNCLISSFFSVRMAWLNVS